MSPVVRYFSAPLAGIIATAFFFPSTSEFHDPFRGQLTRTILKWLFRRGLLAIFLVSFFGFFTFCYVVLQIYGPR